MMIFILELKMVKVSKYHSVIIKDAQATSPYSIFIRGAIYRFEPLV